MIPEDMRVELQAWNNGAGMSLQDWVGCEGNYRLAVGYTTVFWPRFKVMEDYILREEALLSTLKTFEDQARGDRRGVEAVMNHIHIADIHWHGSPETTRDRITFLMPILKEIYEAKLLWQFPDRPCVVELYSPPDSSSLGDY